MPLNVSKILLPFLMIVSLPLAMIVKLDDVIDESKPIASVPSVKSVSVSESDDEVIIMISLPEPETIVSAPLPPLRISSPSSP